MQLGAGRLRQRVVRGVADQQVAEAEGVLARKLRLVRADQLLAHERGESRRRPRLLGSERLDGAAVEDAALDRAALEHAALGADRAGRAGRPAAPGCVGGTATSAVGVRRPSRPSPRRTEGCPRPRRAIRSRRLAGADGLLDQLVRPRRPERLEQDVVALTYRRPAGRRRASSGLAMQSSRMRRIAGEIGARAR